MKYQPFDLNRTVKKRTLPIGYMGESLPQTLPLLLFLIIFMINRSQYAASLLKVVVPRYESVSRNKLLANNHLWRQLLAGLTQLVT